MTAEAMREKGNDCAEEARALGSAVASRCAEVNLSAHEGAHQRHGEIQPFGGGDGASAGLVSPVPQRSGAQVGDGWKDQFADAPDVLKSAPDHRTVVRA